MMAHASAGVPMDHFKVYMDDCKNVASFFVSVGSGNGMYEYEMTKNDEDMRKKLILVDPNPESFMPYPSSNKYIKPHFPLVKDLIKQKPEVVGDCVLILIWPFYQGSYDFESILILEPRSIIILYERPDDWPSGAAGSFLLSSFILKPEIINYKKICSTNYKFKHAVVPLGEIYPRIVWLAKKNTKVPKIKKSETLQKLADLIPFDKYIFYYEHKNKNEIDK